MNKPIDDKTLDIYLQSVPLHALVNAHVVKQDVPNKSSIVAFTTSKQHLTPYGGLNGGIVYVAFELAHLVACIPQCNPVTERPSTISHHVQMIGNVHGEGHKVYVRSTMIKRGKSVAFFEGKAWTEDADGKETVLAKCTTVKAIIQIKQSKL